MSIINFLKLNMYKLARLSFFIIFHLCLFLYLFFTENAKGDVSYSKAEMSDLQSRSAIFMNVFNYYLGVLIEKTVFRNFPFPSQLSGGVMFKFLNVEYCAQIAHICYELHVFYSNDTIPLPSDFILGPKIESIPCGACVSSETRKYIEAISVSEFWFNPASDDWYTHDQMEPELVYFLNSNIHIRIFYTSPTVFFFYITMDIKSGNDNYVLHFTNKSEFMKRVNFVKVKSHIDYDFVSEEIRVLVDDLFFHELQSNCNRLNYMFIYFLFYNRLRLLVIFHGNGGDGKTFFLKRLSELVKVNIKSNSEKFYANLDSNFEDVDFFDEFDKGNGASILQMLSSWSCIESNLQKLVTIFGNSLHLPSAPKTNITANNSTDNRELISFFSRLGSNLKIKFYSLFGTDTDYPIIIVVNKIDTFFAAFKQFFTSDFVINSTDTVVPLEAEYDDNNDEDEETDDDHDDDAYYNNDDEKTLTSKSVESLPKNHEKRLQCFHRRCLRMVFEMRAESIDPNLLNSRYGQVFKNTDYKIGQLLIKFKFYLISSKSVFKTLAYQLSPDKILNLGLSRVQVEYLFVGIFEFCFVEESQRCKILQEILLQKIPRQPQTDNNLMTREDFCIVQEEFGEEVEQNV